MWKTPTNNNKTKAPRSGVRKVLRYAMGALVCALLVTGFFLLRNSAHNTSQPPRVTAQVMQLDGGWGYKIEVNHRLYIYQDQIPCLSGKHLFPTRESAMAIARVVREKIIEGKSPAITREDLEQVMPLSN